MKSIAFLPFIPLLAEGGGAAQGSLILFGLFITFVAAGVAINTLRKRRRSVFSFILSLVALFCAAEIAYVFGLPYDWSYWGAYLPWFPLVLAAWALILTILGAIAQSMLDSDS